MLLCFICLRLTWIKILQGSAASQTGLVG